MHWALQFFSHSSHRNNLTQKGYRKKAKYSIVVVLNTHSSTKVGRFSDSLLNFFPVFKFWFHEILSLLQSFIIFSWKLCLNNSYSLIFCNQIFVKLYYYWSNIWSGTFAKVFGVNWSYFFKAYFSYLQHICLLCLTTEKIWKNT